jgi:hypothetical protein
VILYVQASSRDWFEMGQAGEYETCMKVKYKIVVNRVFAGACCGGHVEMIALMLKKGPVYIDGGVYEVCRGGNIELVNRMMGGPLWNGWNYGLWGAVLKKGASDCGLTPLWQISKIELIGTHL